MPAADTRYLYRLALPCCGAEARTSLPQLPSQANEETLQLYCPPCRQHWIGVVVAWHATSSPAVPEIRWLRPEEDHDAQP